jgi:hypothetical protein
LRKAPFSLLIEVGRVGCTDRLAERGKAMLLRPALVILVAIIVTWPIFAADSSVAIEGTWEGTSTCMVPDSPCHNEHVVYEIKRNSDGKNRYSIDAYKIVAGSRDFMGTLQCQYPAVGGSLRCIGRHPDDVWNFSVSGDSMSGTLTIGAEKQLFRKVSVARAH